jgi:uridylate kinase
VLLACFYLEEIVMLFCSKAEADKINNVPVQTNTRAVETGKIVLGGGFRLPVRTTDTGAIRLGGGFRLPVCQV